MKTIGAALIAIYLILVALVGSLMGVRDVIVGVTMLVSALWVLVAMFNL